VIQLLPLDLRYLFKQSLSERLVHCQTALCERLSVSYWKLLSVSVLLFASMACAYTHTGVAWLSVVLPALLGSCSPVFEDVHTWVGRCVTGSVLIALASY